ncbi:uncharacterized [Tachysurus ichikawai]
MLGNRRVVTEAHYTCIVGNHDSAYKRKSEGRKGTEEVLRCLEAIYGHVAVSVFTCGCVGVHMWLRRCSHVAASHVAASVFTCGCVGVQC